MLRKQPHIDLLLNTNANAKENVQYLIDDVIPRGVPLSRGTMPWCLAAVYNSLGKGSSESASVAAYNAAQCSRDNCPVWYVGDELARALVETEPPVLEMAKVPQIPYKGLYLDLPTGLFQVFNEKTGLHPSWGIYIVADKRPVDVTKYDVSDEWEHSLLVTVVGAVRRRIPITVERHLYDGTVLREDATSLDDAIIYYPVYNGQGPRIDKTNTHFSGLRESWRFVRNLLFALENGTFFLENIQPSASDFPKPRAQSRRRHEASLQKKGKLRPYSVIRLSDAAKKHAKTVTVKKGSAPAGHIRRGHWHSYWVLDPTGTKVFATKVRTDGKTLHKVYRWLHEITVGDGEKSPRHTLRI